MRTLAIGLYVMFVLTVKAHVYGVDLNILTNLIRYYENDGSCSDMKPLILYNMKKCFKFIHSVQYWPC